MASREQASRQLMQVTPALARQASEITAISATTAADAAGRFADRGVPVSNARRLMVDVPAIPSSVRGARRAVDELPHPYGEPVAADHPHCHDRPNAQGQHEER